MVAEHEAICVCCHEEAKKKKKVNRNRGFSQWPRRGADAAGANSQKLTFVVLTQTQIFFKNKKLKTQRKGKVSDGKVFCYDNGDAFVCFFGGW